VRRIAVVGSGPSGCYCAEALLRAAPDCRVDIVDRLPTPFGLVRSGVAPDHQPTKSVARILDRLLARPEIRFYGGVELERDVSLDELRELYDAVVIATGASLDRRLGVPGEGLAGVLTSGRFVGWYNHHPDHADVDLGRVRSAVVIGNGNVALDVARILAKSEAEFAGSDLDPGVARTLADSGVERIAIVGRGSPSTMKCTEVELLEFGELERAYPALGSASDLAGLGGSAAALRGVIEKPHAGKSLEICFEFGLTPLEFVGRERLEAVRFVDTSGVVTVREAELAITCIGYVTHGHGLAVDGGALRNVEGRIDAGLYVAGWAKRGPSGTIPTNRSEAQLVAKKLAAEVVAGDRAGGAGLTRLLESRAVAYVDYAGWRRIDASELARAGANRTRRKWRSLQELFAAATEARAGK
jgi:ferredoxin--NADP+ reductase